MGVKINTLPTEKILSSYKLWMMIGFLNMRMIIIDDLVGL
jgi:hypothetical protein